MTIYIALLRGINVGGHNKIKMADLKSLLESMGLNRVKTYIQSGNVLFESDEPEDLLRERIEQEIIGGFGLSVPVILRKAMEFEQIIKVCPFKAENLPEGESLHISFLAEAPSQDAISHVLTYKSDIEECEIKGKEVYLILRQGFRNSKVLIQLQKLEVQGTLRNWKTVNKLAELAKVLRD
ncbi:DUF1697 domain-containing protein [Bacillus sp. PAMC26568]|nr:DUF1697 domain-containing protein [Bacillus sp. PAMC26568]